MGADAIVLDVKVGDGAFMKTLEAARELAEAMLELGRRAGREVVCVLTDMDQPLGEAVGNALEVREAITTLRGKGPADFTELALASSAHLLSLSDLELDHQAARKQAEQVVADGSALATYVRWVRAQGGDPEESALPVAPVVRSVAAARDGYVKRIGAVRVGVAALRLGAGRSAKEDAIDHAVGVVCKKKRGDRVQAGEPLAEVHARNDAGGAEAVREVLAAYDLADDPPPATPIVIDVVT